MKEARHKGHLLHGYIYVNCWGQANLQKQKVDEQWSRAGAGRIGIWGYPGDDENVLKLTRVMVSGEVRNKGWIPGLGRSAGGGHGNLLQYSCLEDPMDRGAWWATVHGVTWSQTRLTGELSTHGCTTLRMYRKLRHTSHGWTGMALELNFNKSVKKKSMVPRAYLSQTL